MCWHENSSGYLIQLYHLRFLFVVLMENFTSHTHTQTHIHTHTLELQRYTFLKIDIQYIRMARKTPYKLSLESIVLALVYHDMFMGNNWMAIFLASEVIYYIIERTQYWEGEFNMLTYRCQMPHSSNWIVIKCNRICENII